MADPLSMAASILTLLATAQASGQGLQRLLDLRHAPARLDSFRNEITTLRLHLQAVQNALNDFDDKDPTIDLELVLRAVQQATDLMKDLHDFVENKLTRLGKLSMAGSAGGQAVRHLGFLKTSRLQQHIERMKNVRCALDCALNVLTHVRCKGIQLMVQSVSVVQSNDAIKTIHEDLQSSVPTMSTPARTSVVQTMGKISTLNTLSSTTSSVVIRTKLLRQQCEPFCPCQCHIRSCGRTPRWLQSLFGTLFFELNGVPVLNKRQCNFFRCMNTGGSAQFEYRVPSYLFAGILRISTTWGDLGGIRGNFSLHPIYYLPENARYDLYKILLKGTPQHLDMYLDRYGFSARTLDRSDNQSLLDDAMLRARWDMASVLLRRGADIHHRPNSNITSIMAIYERGRLEKNPSDHCYHDLLQGEDVSEILQLNVAHQIILGLSPQDLEEQIGVHPSLIHERDGFGRTPLHWAAALEDYHAAELLIEHGAKLEDMDKRLSTPLSLSATWNSGTELCELLISAGASIDGPEGCRSPLYCAVVRSKNTPIVPLLLKYRADPRGFHFGRSILSRAIMFGHTDCLRDIVHFGADIDGPPSSGKMPIMDAVIRDDLSCIDFMLQQKPRLDVLDNCGDSILAYVARYSSIPVMNFLAQTDLGGISVCSRDIERCWEYFENRNFSGELPTEEEYAAFRGFLESVVPAAVLRKIEDVDSDDSSTASDGSSSDEEEFEDAQEVIGE